MNDERKRLNILLVEDSADKSELMRGALERSKNRCNLHTVGTGRSTLAYLRGVGAYSQAPRPDLVFFDVANGESNRLKILDQVRDDVAAREIPLVLLTTPESEQLMETTYDQEDSSVVFSAIELDSFLRTMRARTPDRFLSAVALIQKLGFVLVRIPGEAGESGATLSIAAAQ